MLYFLFLYVPATAPDGLSCCAHPAGLLTQQARSSIPVVSVQVHESHDVRSVRLPANESPGQRQVWLHAGGVLTVLRPGQLADAAVPVVIPDAVCVHHLLPSVRHLHLDQGMVPGG